MIRSIILSLKNSLTGILLIIAAAYFATLIESADVIANIIASILLCLTLVILLYLLLAYLLIRKNSELLLFSKDKKLISRNSHNFDFTFKNLKLPPGIKLLVKPVFAKTKSSPILIEFRGKKNKGCLDLVFPHHGLWESSESEYFLEDILGLFSINLKIKNKLIFKVYPESSSKNKIPLPSSSAEESILFNYSETSSQGDYYDLKKYHPADGLRRIIWRAFAKHGELISRHPEKINYLDERSTIIYLANYQNEKLAASCLDFVKLLSREEIRFDLFSLESEGCANNLETANNLIIESAWQNPKKIADFQQADLRKLFNKRESKSYLVFVKENDQLLNKLKNYAKANNISLSFCLEKADQPKTGFSVKNVINKIILEKQISKSEGEIVNA